MTWVKICGITNLEDALTAVEAGADALGFVFYEKSPRKVEPDKVREIVEALPVQVEKVGVFVNQPRERIDQCAQQTGLTMVQLCGKESVTAFTNYLRMRRDVNHGLKVTAVIPSGELAEAELFVAGELKHLLHSLLIDSGSDARPGGTGKRFDWEKARGMFKQLGLSIPTIVAGGLTAENVADALATLHPWGVDVSSGVESKPGKKDPDKIRAFVSAVRQAERLV
jgi:phosphoribosylanthranilate isomerase